MPNTERLGAQQRRSGPWISKMIAYLCISAALKASWAGYWPNETSQQPSVSSGHVNTAWGVLVPTNHIAYTVQKPGDICLALGQRGLEKIWRELAQVLWDLRMLIEPGVPASPPLSVEWGGSQKEKSPWERGMLILQVSCWSACTEIDLRRSKRRIWLWSS